MATQADIVHALRTSDVAVARALVILFRNQTAHEQASNTTNVLNAKGFTASDAHWGSIHAKTVLRDGKLRDYQLVYWRKPGRNGKMRIARYWRQLLIAADEKQQRILAKQAAAA